ncbi:MAG TPA: glycosyl hydrolase [Thermoanaerobaculia bacterium]|nr:glycosyl hydrolase [Thermoanaerobaculia bacterium]
MRVRRLILTLSLLIVSLPLVAQNVPETLFNGMKWRLVGPFRGGRAVAATGVPGDPNTYYFGAVAGGVWKSTDGGGNWTPLFDKQSVASIGAVAVADSDPNVIYAGTGEGCIRGNLASGDGVYKSTDGGRTWRNVGLRDTQHIGALIIHPRDPNIVFVAALGHAYGPNAERGIFRTVDGGKSWEKVLFKNDHTGGVDVVFDPHSPSILYAALWEVMRTPWSLTSGGEGSGLYKSIDGGATWKRIEGDGLPKGIMGRIGVSVSGADGNRIYALIEADEGGIYRSDDGGDTWTRVNDDERYRQRAWYFSHLFADPKSADTVYVLNTGLFRSTDAGKTFTLLPAPHGDHHALWIDPANPQRMINGNDGGITITTDAGKTWTRQDNQPTAQFYHVVADNDYPYRLYGAQQDNSSVAIASRTDDGTIDRQHWYDVGGGESGCIAPDPRDANIVYAGDNGGVLTRWDKRTGQAQVINVWPLDTSGLGAESLEHRFQWTEPVLISPHDPNTLYTCAEVVFKTTDGGMHWTAISPDLTRNDKSKQKPSGGPITLDITSVEYYDTVFALAESPVKSGLLWAGTDDGLVHVTQDGGKNWTNVTPKGMPEWSMISQIDASPHDPGTAYIAVDRHKLDDLRPYIYKTSDYGKSWTKLTAGIGETAFVRAVRQDTKRKDLLYAGTELGPYVSFDDGQHWQPLQLNLPVTPVTDLVIKDDDLAISTNGRAFWILDDLAPLRQASTQLPASGMHLYQPAATVRLHYPEQVDKRRPVGLSPTGGFIDYWFRSEPKEEVTLEIKDSQGRVVRTFSSQKKKSKFEQPPEWPDLEKPPELIPAKEGMNRFPWNLRWESPLETPGAFYQGNGPEGPIALPGKYHLTLTWNGKSETAELEVRPDPRVKNSAEDLRSQFELSMKVRDRIAELHQAINQIRGVRGDLESLKQRLEASGKSKEVLAAIEKLEKSMAPIEQELTQVKLKSSEGTLRYPSMLNEQFDTFIHMIENADTAPTQPMLDVYDGLQKRLAAQLAKWKAITATDLPALDAMARKENVPLVIVRD